MIDHYQNEKGLTSIVFDVSFCFKGTLRNEAFGGELSKNYSLGLKPPQLLLRPYVAAASVAARPRDEKQEAGG